MKENDCTLVVDLDGTLIKSDMLYESFFAVLRTNIGLAFKAILKGLRGKAAAKEYLAAQSVICEPLLPYNENVIEFIKDFKRGGGRVELVTATNQNLAERVAKHVDLFDEVHGSSSTQNLKGVTKAKFLVAKFGRGNFWYMADHAADIPVWRESKKAITVNASLGLRKKVEKLHKPTEHLGSRSNVYLPYLRALRPHQWLKNLLVFLPMIAAHELTHDKLLSSVLTFMSFCLVASAVYIANDALDLESDRSHPRKRFRPFAAGALALSSGLVLMPLLLGLGLFLAALVGENSLIILTAYLASTSAYSLRLKRIAVLDIFTLSILYVMRVFAGGVSTDIHLSSWLLTFIIFLFFSLAAVKRQAELIDLQARGATSTSGRGYQVQDLPVIMAAALTSGYVSVLVLAIYVSSPAVSELYSAPTALFGICWILLWWITRVVFLTNRGRMHDDPVVFAIKDKASFLALFIVMLFGSVGSLS